MTPIDSESTFADLLDLGQSIDSFFITSTKGDKSNLPLEVLAALRDEPLEKTSPLLKALRDVFPQASDQDFLARAALLYLHYKKINRHRKDANRAAVFAKLHAAHPAFLSSDCLASKSEAAKVQAVKFQGRYLDWLDELEARHNAGAERHLISSDDHAHRARCKLGLAHAQAQRLVDSPKGKSHPARTKLYTTVLDELSTQLVELLDSNLAEGGRFALNSFDLLLNTWGAAMHDATSPVKATCFPSERIGFGSIGEANLKLLAGDPPRRNGHGRSITRYIIGDIPPAARIAFAEQHGRGVALRIVDSGQFDDCKRYLPPEVKSPDLVLVTGQVCYETVHIDTEKLIGRGYLYTNAEALASFDKFFKAIDSTKPRPFAL